MRKKSFAQMKEWALRICLVDLCHVVLKGDSEGQKELASFIKDNFPEMESENLESASYPSLIGRCRLIFMRIASSRQNPALQSFISRSIKYLSPQMLVGVDASVKHRVQNYIDALASGKLQPEESQALQLISQGCLQADELAKALVPSLLLKADRTRRGRTIRTGSSAGSSQGISELGFMLGGLLQNKDLQKAFGISKLAVKDARPPLLTPLLPQFFVAEGAKLQQASKLPMAYCDTKLDPTGKPT